MKAYSFILLVIALMLGCRQPFLQPSETVVVSPLKVVNTKESVVFITGFDAGENTYYSNAKRYFEAKGMRVVDSLFSLEEILEWINQKGKKRITFSEIHIVSHSNAWLGMAMKTTRNGKRITLKTLRKARRENTIPKLQRGITSETKVIFHSCGLGENPRLLRELKDGFTVTEAPKVYASVFFNVFGGKFAPHYLAKPYYGYYPTAESPGPAQLSKEFEFAYPETPINWRKAMKTRREAGSGEAYSFKFNIPIVWEFTFDTTEEVPNLEDRDAIMDWISESPEMAEVLFELNIPLEKYRWKTQIQGKKLLVKGKTTVLCILAPLLEGQHQEEYRVAKVDDRSLYQIL